MTNQSTTADETGCIHFKTQMKVAILSVLTNTLSIGNLSPITTINALIDTHIDY